MKDELLPEMARRLQEGDWEGVAGLTDRALESGLAPQRILEEGLLAGMGVVGARFREREIFLPDVLLAAKAMAAGVKRLEPKLSPGALGASGRVVLGTVQGDLHDIGKNLVGIMLRGAGFEVLDLGKDVSAERFVEAAVESGAGFIGMSALLTTTMPAMGRVVELLRRRGLSGRIKTLVGGAPVSEAYAREIGADLYAYDAGSAADRLKGICPPRGGEFSVGGS